MFDADSDYIVEQYVKPNRVGKKLINDERADILGNFDDDDDKYVKKKGKKAKNLEEIAKVSEENPFADADDDDDVDDNEEDKASENEEQNGNESDSEVDNDVDVQSDAEAENELDAKVDSDENMEVVADGNESSEDVSIEPEPEPEPESKVPNKKEPKAKKKKSKPVESTEPSTSKKTDLNDDQIKALIRGASKQDRFVLYVTNLNYSTNRDTLQDFFEVAGSVRSVRIPKVRKNAFAFIEMTDLNGFKNALALHNRTLDNYTIKVQISEGGKKKSANKKNILKQKNRKLAEMRNEGKQFQRSGKGYDKTIKKEIHQQKMQQNRRLAKQQAKKQAKK